MSEPHLTEPLWRAIAVYRAASLGYAVALVATIDRHDYSRLDWAWAVLAAMAVWTIVSTVGYASPERRGIPLLTADLGVTAGLLLSTWGLQFPVGLHRGIMPVTATWVAGPVLAWAVRYGWQAGLSAALVLSGCDFALRGGAAGTITVTLDGAVLMVLAGVIVARLAAIAGVPVVPAGITGTRTLLPPGSGRPRRARVTVSFGIPIAVSGYAADTVTGRARDGVAALVSAPS